MRRTLCGLALVPTDPAVDDEITAYAKTVMACTPAISVLGQFARPHVTLLHAYHDQPFAASLDRLVGATAVVRPNGLHLLPFTEPYNAEPDIGVQMMVEVPIDLTEPLRTLQHTARRSRLAEDGDVTVGGMSWTWRPHFTLGFASGPPTAPMPLPPFSGRDIRCRVALGIMGPLGVFEAEAFVQVTQ